MFRVTVPQAAALLALALICPPSFGLTLSLTEWSAFIASPELDPDPTDPTLNAIQQTGIGGGIDEFSAYGLGVGFTSALDADNLGDITWWVTNGTGASLGPFWFFGFLDADIGVPFFNEYGDFVSVGGTGSGDDAPDAWEIAEPYGLGGLLDTLLAGSLGNVNRVPAGSEDDVALALGFQVAGLGVGETLTARFTVSTSDIGGLRQTAANSGEQVWFNGSVTVGAAPAPGMLSLLLFAPLAAWFRRRRDSARQ